VLSPASLFALGRTIDATPDVNPEDLARSLVLYTAERQAEVAGVMMEMGEPSNTPFCGEIQGSMRVDGDTKIELHCEIVDTPLNLDVRSDVLLSISPAQGSHIDDLGMVLTGHANRALFVLYWSFKTPDNTYPHDSNDTVLPFIAHVDVEACKNAGISEYVVARLLLSNAFFGIHHD